MSQPNPLSPEAREEMHPPSCRCWNCDMETTGLVRGLRATIAELQGQLETAKSDLDIMESCARSYDRKQPFCEHENRYTFTEDGGKTGYCVMCQNAALQAEVAGLRAALHAALYGKETVLGNGHCIQHRARTIELWNKDPNFDVVKTAREIQEYQEKTHNTLVALSHTFLPDK